VRNNGKNRSEADSLSASEAAALLGVSNPTLKRMARDSTLESFRTPGGHLRITAESLDAMRNGRQSRPWPVRDASPVLQNRRERLEELTLEAQEHRARRELEKLRAEEREEADRREVEAQAREEEAAQRRGELELERERLKLEKAQERARQERAQAEEWDRREREGELATFRCRWQEKATELVTAFEYRWLSATQRKEVVEGLEAEIERRQPADEPRMGTILARGIEALIEPFRADRDAQERRQRLTDEALRSLPCLATEAERARAAHAIQEAHGRFNNFWGPSELRVAAQDAIKPVREAVERRLLTDRLLWWAIWQLPFGSRTDYDVARVRRECTEILADLPMDITEVEARESLASTIQEACQEIEKRQSEKARQARKASLIRHGIEEVSRYLLELKGRGEITAEEWLDSQITAHLQEAVRRNSECKLSGNETTKEVEKRVRVIIDAELK
jgi:excisionase family DNA binding protein